MIRTAPAVSSPPPREAVAGDNVAGIQAEELKQFIARIERLHEEREAIAGDIRDVFAEAKGRGFNTKVMRMVLARRRKDHAELQEEDAIFDLYLDALGMA